jgi:hypothetical protein
MHECALNDPRFNVICSLQLVHYIAMSCLESRSTGSYKSVDRTYVCGSLIASMHTNIPREIQESIVKHRYTFLLFVYRSVSTYRGDDERATCRWRHYIRKRRPLLGYGGSIRGMSESISHVDRPWPNVIVSRELSLTRRSFRDVVNT